MVAQQVYNKQFLPPLDLEALKTQAQGKKGFMSRMQDMEKNARKQRQDTMAWAWGINCGFSVLGSILSIIIAQFSGFNVVLLSAGILYLIAMSSFFKFTQQ